MLEAMQAGKINMLHKVLFYRSVTAMLDEYNLQTLQECQAQAPVILFCCAANKLVNIDLEHYLSPITTSKRGHNLK